MKRFTYLLLLLSPLFAFTQKRLDLVHEKAFAFYDYQEKAFCALDDSTFIWKYNARKEKWEKTPIQLLIEMPFEKFLAEFIPMSEKGTPVYFVHSGCGVVYSMNNNMIKRHDHSFYHMNQFNGSFFMDNGEPRIYGGYGLFTSKNIITRYDTTEREWFAIRTINYPPPSGVENITLKNKNSYFVFDGFKGSSNQFTPLMNIWQLDLRLKKWRKIGKLNSAIQGMRRMTTRNVYQIQNKSFSCFPNMIVSYDLDKLRFKKYLIGSSGLYVNIINIGSLYLTRKNSSKPSSYIEISDGSFLKNMECKVGNMLMKEPDSPSYIWFFIVFIFGLSVMIYYRKIKSNKTINRKIVLNNKTFEISLDEFNQNERELIRLLIIYKESGLEISYINDLVNYDQPSIDTLKKRREILLKDLRYKLASKFNLSPEEVFFERRTETDKRMKLLFLNDRLPELLSNQSKIIL